MLRVSFKYSSLVRGLASPQSTVSLRVSRWNSSNPVKESNAMDIGSCLEVSHARWPRSLRVSHLWLRDHCRCQACYNHTTSQRIFDIATLHHNIRPAAIVATPEGIELKWPDGHTSTYDYQFLWQNNHQGYTTSHKSPHLPWTASTFPEIHQTTVPLGDLENPNKNGLRKLFGSFVKHGLAIISEVPADLESTRAAVENVCAIKKTFFGDMWAMQGTNYEHYDTAYSSIFIGAHTDNTYFSNSSRVQVFHCLQPASKGGENLLVDGFSVARQFQEKHPEGYRFLSSTAIPSEYREEGQHYVSLDKVIKLNPVTGQIYQFRYNIYDRAPLYSIPLEKMEEFYRHYTDLSNIIRNTKNEYWFALQPGTVLLVDNWRLLHGRNSFHGTRVMSGCYLDNDVFTSAARVLGLQLH